MAGLKSESLSTKVADILSERIIRKEILPGQRILEIKLANEFEVSQGTIREAFRILEKRKMVTIRGRKGTFVTRIDSDYIESLYSISAELYCLMTRKIVKKISDENIAELADILKSLRDCATRKDSHEYGKALYKGIDLLLRIANDPLLEHSIKELWQIIRWVEYEMLQYRKNHLMENYRHLKKYADLLTGKKMEEAVQHMRELSYFAMQFSLKAVGDSRPSKQTAKRKSA